MVGRAWTTATPRRKERAAGSGCVSGSDSRAREHAFLDRRGMDSAVGQTIASLILRPGRAAGRPGCGVFVV